MTRLSVLVCCVGLFTALAPSARAADPTFDEIKTALHDWRNSFSTIRVVWFGWNDKLTRNLIPGIDPNMPLDGNFGTREEFDWADFGAYVHRFDSLREAQVSSRSHRGNDGLQPWSATNTEGKPDHWFAIRREKPIPDRPIMSNVVKSALHGLWIPNLGMWLPDILEKHDSVALDRFEMREGVRHAVVRVEWESNRQEFWLSPDHGWLPDYSESFYRNKTDTGWGPAWEWIAEEFKTFGDKTLFPARGKLLSKQELMVDWRVHEVTVNLPLARADFGPPAPHVGTKIYNNVTGNFERHGISKQEAQSTQESVKTKTSPSALLPRSNAEIAIPASSLRKSQWLVAIFASLSIVAGIVLRRRSSGA